MTSHEEELAAECLASKEVLLLPCPILSSHFAISFAFGSTSHLEKTMPLYSAFGFRRVPTVLNSPHRF